MPVFYLSDYDILKLRHRFNLFQKERRIIHSLLHSYIADYRQFTGPMSKRYEYLRKKYISQSPNLTHLIMLDGAILWSLQDISILLGKHLTTIIRSINKMEHSEGWCSRLLSIRTTTKNLNGRTIQVYHEDIFDLLLDLYEDEYLLRFSEPRRGDNNSAPDIHELRRFWLYLKDLDSFNSHVVNEPQHLQDVPPMSWKDLISLIWRKVFTFKVSTVASLVFALCFELARRFFGFHLWFALLPALVALLSAFLIHRRKFNPDLLSDIGAGAFFCLLLCLSASLSSDKLSPTLEDKQQVLTQDVLTQSIHLTPTLGGLDNSLNFAINVQNYGSVKAFFYRLSPDVAFRSMGFIDSYNALNPQHPNNLLSLPMREGITYIDLKFTDKDDRESTIYAFSVDIPLEMFKLHKQFILSNTTAWVTADHNSIMNAVTVNLNPILFSSESIHSIDYLAYGINTLSPDTVLHLVNDRDKYNTPFGYGVLLFDESNITEFVSSYLIFKDGSSSDIRLSYARKDD